MDQNQTQSQPSPVADNDLQKAIDDITNTTNVDPVFSDPVAAPSSVPEGDTGELDEAVGPFPEPKVSTIEKTPEPIAPLESMNIPEFNMPPAPSVPEAAPAPVAPAPAPVAPAPAPTPEPAPAPAPAPAPEPAPEPIPESLNTSEVKKAALRDLVPLLDRISMDESEKFKIYRDIFDDLKDYTILEPAYRAAREISDETERAEALLYLVKSIDKM
ncbi:hypothetical protein IKF92_03330 [Candidatus Saccharibacteria bacterium]|nr:hypothetical protein [Candidatus Saccharibacteria bacterium]